ncbi:GDSL esterase/lipase At4g16230-like isoform X2 [Magnolia sinica]|uniref:GDSL esterase/lipase At4g16230-like isoform X2 n=1 Tax=Magnolia sinica TaxID=86752 RepID=UPI00265A4A66|nr:GDSL esterase/lipase At4g16230-like isoform X2 [Magnolia sinica]
MDSFINHRFIIAFLSAIAGFLLLGICSVDGIPASFVFGDSLVDAGNNNYIVSLSKADMVPNGIDFMPYRQPTGRYTNGRTTVDLIGQELGLTGFTPPYLAPTTAGAAAFHGVNYASGGGGILNETGKIFVGRINLDAQIDNYANTRQDMLSSIGMPETLKLLKNSIFSITMGSNDFINNYLMPGVSNGGRNLVSPEAFVDSMITKYRLQLTRLYSLDARKIIVVNVGPIGCIPFEREINPMVGENCVPFPNQLANSFNMKLKSLVMELNLNLEGALFVYADVYRIVSDIIQNFSSFENPCSACCSAAGRFGGLIPCGLSSKVCLDRSKYVFWDPYHPSDAANSIIAMRLMDGDSNDIFPMNVRQLAQA